MQNSQVMTCMPFTDVDCKFSNNLTAGVFYNIVIPCNQGRWSIANELVYTSYLYNTEYCDTYNTDIYTDYTISLGSELIKLNIFLKYKLPVKKVNLYLKGGILRGIVISQTNSMKIEDHIYSVTDVEEKEAIEYTNNGEKGYAIGLGASIKKFSIEGRYERASGMSAIIALSSIVYRYVFIISYIF